MGEKKSGLRGVFWDAKTLRWRSQIGFRTRKVFNGYFDTVEEAGRAYDMKYFELHGDDARAAAGKTNFPVEDYCPDLHTAAGRPVPPEVSARAAEICAARARREADAAAAVAAAAAGGASDEEGEQGGEPQQESLGAEAMEASEQLAVRRSKRRAAQSNLLVHLGEDFVYDGPDSSGDMQDEPGSGSKGRPAPRWRSSAATPC
ncbi:hypothetical protein MNEG_3832 [Monoraphidium neglectum]|uniref:AP2/ERF domain-containing protein n=1 Tax=Monoraphidium neglectum TaxID=145388 RepID=A0A0D2MUE4_9CHLO|nr:hypothetical protein MNEG_3832 [Monoraphidium neglectum]KIZ04132.1 hypothetical protein MNEG_3832 [Monoraphidium neglectum]|eukprot:XP_013903151.1 hypothetical protein MNEG_3832 [Monoraphidium neglectum]